MRYRLRTLLIVLGVLPPVLAAGWFTIAGLANMPSYIFVLGEVLWILIGLAMAIALAIGLGFVVTGICDAVIGLWDER